MSDDISIPRPALSGSASGRTSFTHSYRSRRAGMDTGTKRLVIAASGLGVILLGGMAVWSFSGGHTTTGVPRIEADNRPMRVKPENPGGMVAIGVGDSSAIGRGGTDLAPAAEQPDPQALLAQRRAASPPKIASAPAAAPSPPAALPQLPVATAQPLSASPAPMQATPVAAPGSDLAARPPRAASGGPLVQLAAVETEAGATAEWQRLSHKLPDLLGERQPVVQRAESGGKAVWRLRTGGFTDVADATQFCKRARAKGIGCSLANF